MEVNQVRELMENYNSIVDTVTSTVKKPIQNQANKKFGPLGGFVAGKEVDAIGGDVKSGNYGSALNRTIKGASRLFNSYEPDKFDIILEYLVVEGYANTQNAAIAIMANMSEGWRQSIVEMSDKESRIEFERKAMAAGKSPVGYQRMLDAQKREKEYMEWEKKRPKPSGGYKGL